jgi:type IV secretion system protein TrbL
MSMRLLVFAVGTLLLTAQQCSAFDGDVVTQITAAYANKATLYGTALRVYAERLFYWCLVLDVAYLGIKCVLSREQIADILKQFCLILLVAGFFFAVITHYQSWTGNIINGLKGIGTAIGAPDLELGPFSEGIKVAKQVLTKVSITSPAESLGFLVAAGVIMICFALMTAQIILIKCESYIAMNAAVLLLGFGGSRFLKEYAVNTLRYALSVAFKLFVMQLVMGIGMSFVTAFSTSSTELLDLLVLIGAAVVLLALVKTLPEICAGIITGSHSGSGSALTSTAGAVAGAGLVMAGAAANTVRGAHTVRDAARLASQQGSPGFAQTARNLWEANQTARRENNSRGSIGQRMSSAMKDSLDAAKITNQDKN